MDVREKASNKKRLIDYDKLYLYVMGAGLSSCDEDTIFDLMDDSAVDAVEVVRCIDCKHYLIVDETFCMRRYMCTVNHFSYLENDGDNHFCSYGERKEGVKWPKE